MPKIAIGITGLGENLARYEGIGVPYWGPSIECMYVFMYS